MQVTQRTRVTNDTRWGNQTAEVEVTVEAGDYTTPDGYLHIDGHYRVTARFVEGGTPYVGKSYKGRARNFKGETAWMDADRLAGDIVSEIRYGR